MHIHEKKSYGVVNHIEKKKKKTMTFPRHISLVATFCDYFLAYKNVTQPSRRALLH